MGLRLKTVQQGFLICCSQALLHHTVTVQCLRPLEADPEINRKASDQRNALFGPIQKLIKKETSQTIMEVIV